MHSRHSPARGPSTHRKPTVLCPWALLSWDSLLGVKACSPSQSLYATLYWLIQVHIEQPDLRSHPTRDYHKICVAGCKLLLDTVSNVVTEGVKHQYSTHTKAGFRPLLPNLIGPVNHKVGAHPSFRLYTDDHAVRKPNVHWHSLQICSQSVSVCRAAQHCRHPVFFFHWRTYIYAPAWHTSTQLYSLMACWRKLCLVGVSGLPKRVVVWEVKVDHESLESSQLLFVGVLKMLILRLSENTFLLKNFRIHWILLEFLALKRSLGILLYWLASWRAFALIRSEDIVN